jgi:hypothetical protein
MGKPRINLTGQTFYYLTIESYFDCGKWWATCICGSKCLVVAGDLKRGKIKSCGCMHHQREDLIGQRFENLIVESYAGNNNQGNSLWNCRCDCGTLHIIRGADLKSGASKTCGDSKNCEYAFIFASSRAKKHGLSNTKQYHCWNDFIKRCYDPDCPAFSKYGGRIIDGILVPITVYDPWRENFQAFYNYIEFDSRMPETLAQFKARNPGKQAVIDRINNDGNYEPNNIRWVTYQESNQNKRNNTLNPIMVNIIQIEFQNGKSIEEIFQFLKTNYNYKGLLPSIYNVISNKIWTNITV